MIAFDLQYAQITPFSLRQKTVALRVVVFRYLRKTGGGLKNPRIRVEVKKWEFVLKFTIGNISTYWIVI